MNGASTQGDVFVRARIVFLANNLVLRENISTGTYTARAGIIENLADVGAASGVASPTGG